LPKRRRGPSPFSTGTRAEPRRTRRRSPPSAPGWASPRSPSAGLLAGEATARLRDGAGVRVGRRGRRRPTGVGFDVGAGNGTLGRDRRRVDGDRHRRTAGLQPVELVHDGGHPGLALGLGPTPLAQEHVGTELPQQMVDLLARLHLLDLDLSLLHAGLRLVGQDRGLSLHLVHQSHGRPPLALPVPVGLPGLRFLLSVLLDPPSSGPPVHPVSAVRPGSGAAAPRRGDWTGRSGTAPQWPRARGTARRRRGRIPYPPRCRRARPWGSASAGRSPPR